MIVQVLDKPKNFLIIFFINELTSIFINYMLNVRIRTLDFDSIKDVVPNL